MSIIKFKPGMLFLYEYVFATALGRYNTTWLNVGKVNL